MSMYYRLATGVFTLAVMSLLVASAPGQQGEPRQAGEVDPSNPQFARPAPLESLTPEEAERPWEEWTEQQILAKGWTPYRCACDQGRAPEGRRWPQNDPGPARNGTCITYSFMPDGLVLANPPDTDGGGMTQFRTVLAPAVGGLAPAMAAVNAAMGTWTAAADIHAVLVADNGVAFDAAGAVGDIRITAHSMAMINLAWAYYPPPNGVSLAGDVHFNHGQVWVVAGAPAVPPPYDLQTVALHELGHALGLDHAGTEAADVMFGAYTGPKRALTPADIANIQAVYGAAGHAAECNWGGDAPRPIADLDDDADVDVDDFWLFVDAFGRCQGHPAYIDVADYDDDDCITLVDYQIWLLSYANYMDAY